MDDSGLPAIDSLPVRHSRNGGKTVSIAVTTFGTQSFYSHACLEAIRAWKLDHHELLVAVHDASLLLEFYLKGCCRDGLIDVLLVTSPGAGHLQGVTECFAAAQADTLVNIANDIVIGLAIVDDCVDKLANDSRLGLIGWHWYNEGTTWQSDGSVCFQARDANRPWLEASEIENLKRSPAFTGRLFEAMGGPYWLCLCNTAFFAVRRETWERVGGFEGPYRHYFADDYLNYKILDQGLDVRAFEGKFKRPTYFQEFQYANLDVQDRRRNDDSVPVPQSLAEYVDFLGGGLNASECQLLYQIARSLPARARVLHVGIWRGSGLILFLHAMRDRAATFMVIDCFDLPGISELSCQPPVSREEAAKYVRPFIAAAHDVTFVRANTLNLDRFPVADCIFIDAGHTEECIRHDLHCAVDAVTNEGLLVFHDYGEPTWPAVGRVIQEHFGNLVRVQARLACISGWEAKRCLSKCSSTISIAPRA